MDEDLKADALRDVDAILAHQILEADAVRPFQGHEALTVRAILALSRTRNPAAMRQARDLMTALLATREV